MSGTTSNIIIGAASVLINDVDIGFTKGGSSVRYEPSFTDIEADQVQGVVKKFRNMEKMYVKTTLLEQTLSNLRLSFMQPEEHLSGSRLLLGYGNPCYVEENKIVLVGKSPGCGLRTFTLNRCVSVGEKEYNMNRDEETAFEIEFECLKGADGLFGQIVDG